jgi:hypothetical protein
MMKKGNKAIVQVLIKWKHLPDETATWEDWDVLKLRFPEVLTWGQASFSPGGSVTADTEEYLSPEDVLMEST